MNAGIKVGLKDEITERVQQYMNSQYETTDANVVPDKTTVQFGAKAKKLSAVAMYVDLRGSRQLLSEHSKLLSARAHKSFLYAAAKCVRAEDGHLRSFNGDSVLSFFKGDGMDKRAVRAAMKIKYTVLYIINPELKKKDVNGLDFGIGIGRGDILIVKSGVAGEESNQDLIWIGWPTYHAFEYGDIARSPRNIWISRNVYNQIKNDNNMIYSNGKTMWVYNDDHKFSFGKVRVYKTSYYWNI